MKHTNHLGEAGRSGPDVRSDCRVTVQVTASGGLTVDLRSKVESLYGDSTRRLVADAMATMGVRHARVEVEDSGALPFVILARLEAAARRAGHRLCGVALPELAPGALHPTQRDRFRRSRLYLPGNEPKFMLNAGLHRPDGVILDLEDSVAPTEKDAARLLVRNALIALDFDGAERMVRINQGDAGFEDLAATIPYGVDVVLIPKVEKPEHVHDVDDCVQSLRFEHGIEHDVFLMPIVESALGVVRAYDIAHSTPNVVALTIGLEDYCADMGIARTPEGRESFYARAQVANAAHAAGVQAIDSVFSDVDDEGALRASVLEAKSLGFEGKGCIHPRQIRVVHQAFAPTAKELERANQIVKAYEEAEAKGLGVVALGSKMIDPPVVKRALRVVRLAAALGEEE